MTDANGSIPPEPVSRLNKFDGLVPAEPAGPSKPVPFNIGFQIALLAEIPVILLLLVSSVLSLWNSVPTAIVSVLLLIPQGVAYLWWQIKSTRESLARGAYLTPSYWQVLALFVIWGSAVSIPAAFLITATDSIGHSQAITGIIMLVYLAIVWAGTAALVGKFLATPWPEKTSKIISIIFLLIGACMALFMGLIVFVATALFGYSA